MAYFVILFGIYVVLVALNGKGKQFGALVIQNAEGAGVWLVGWIILLVAAKIWRPFYYVAILAGLTYILSKHNQLFQNLSDIYQEISDLSKGESS